MTRFYGSRCCWWGCSLDILLKKEKKRYFIILQNVERCENSVEIYHLSSDYNTFAGATDGVVVVFAAAGVVTDAGVGVVLTAAVVAATFGFAAVVVAAGLGFVAVAVVVADTALASCLRNK